MQTVTWILVYQSQTKKNALQSFEGNQILTTPGVIAVGFVKYLCVNLEEVGFFFYAYKSSVRVLIGKVLELSISGY